MEYTKDFLVQIHKDLMQERMLEEKLVELYAAGRVPGHIHSGDGQEAAYTGLLATRKPGDYFRIPHRVIAANVTVGSPLVTFFGEILAKKCGNALGHGGVNHLGRLQDGVLGMSGTLGCDAALPVGAGLTIQYNGTDNIAYYIVGDGASNRGPVSEAMTLAADWKVPVLFVCINNGYAISTPSVPSGSTHGIDSTGKDSQFYSSPVANVMADRGPAYGMPSWVADGTDVLATYEEAAKAVDYVRAGNGPAILELKCYRWRGHFEGDQCPYRNGSYTKDQIENHDGLKMFEDKLIAEGVMTAEEIAQCHKDFDAEMEVAIAEAEASPEMTADEIYDCLYV